MTHLPIPTSVIISDIRGTITRSNEAVAWLDEPTFCITFRQRQAANLYRKRLTSTEMDWRKVMKVMKYASAPRFHWLIVPLPSYLPSLRRLHIWIASSSPPYDAWAVRTLVSSSCYGLLVPSSIPRFYTRRSRPSQWEALTESVEWRMSVMCVDCISEMNLS